jgi:hypothetical protein
MNWAFRKAADEILMAWNKTQEVSERLGEGGEREDLPNWYLPYIRSANHFHNPLEPEIENAGFSGLLSGWLLQGESSVLWSQKPPGLSKAPGAVIPGMMFDITTIPRSPQPTKPKEIGILLQPSGVSAS